MFKKCVSVLCVALIAAASFVLPVHAQEGSVSVSAQAAVVINADNGQVLYAKNAENQQAMASTTKIMTALLTLEEAAKENKIVTISEQVAAVEGSSMYPTLVNHERLLVNKFTYFVSDPQKGEIIVFRYPKDESRDFIKRVIATAGDTVEMRSGKVLVNGTEIDEPYTWKEDPKGPNLSDYRKSVVPEGHIFVLGDNRNNSEDSRFADVGFVPLDLVKGKASLAFWPVDRWRMLP